MDRSATAALALLVLYVLTRGLLLLAIVPPWQGPDEPGHAQVGLLLARERRWVRTGDPVLEQAILASMAEHGFYARLGVPMPAPPPEVFSDVERLGGSPTQLESETPVGYLPYALTAAFVPDGPVSAALARMRLASLALLVVTIVVAGWATREALGTRLAPPAAALVAAAPMLGFSGAVVNNDLSAAALCALWYGLLARIARRGTTRRRVVLLIAITLVAVAAKRTTLYLLPSLCVLVMPIGWRETEDGHGAPAFRLSPGWPERRRGLASAALGGALLAGALLLPVGSEAVGWQRVGPAWGAERSPTAARTGSHGLRVEDASATTWSYLEQWVGVTGGASVTGSAWLRSEEPGTRAQLVVSDDRGQWLGDTVAVSPDWTHVSVTGQVAPDARRVRLAIVPGDGLAAGVGALDADDVSLSIGGGERLSNGGAEVPRRLGGVLASGALQYTDARRVVGAVAGGLAEPARTLGRAWRGLAFGFRSFWGGFGWLTVWPPTPAYFLAGVITATVMGGVAMSLFAPGRLVGDPRGAVTLRAWALTVVLAVAVALVGSVAGRGVEGVLAGRYLLPVLVPLAAAAVALAERLWERWGPLALAGTALALDAALIVWVVWPGFHGGP